MLDGLLFRLRAILGERLIGLYLYGSLAAGDFDEASSDVDFIAAVSSSLDDREMAALAAMHEGLAADGGAWGRRLEGAYLPLAALRRDEPRDVRHPFLSEDTPFGMHELGRDWVINRYVVREKGVTVYGPPPATLVDPVTPAELTEAVRVTLRTGWRHYLDHPEPLRTRRYQAFAILTMCRALHALAHTDFASKPAAARWAEHALEPEWTPLIRRALRWRRDDDHAVDDDALPETLRFIRYALSRG